MDKQTLERFREADSELSTRLGYVLERARELIDCYPSRFKNEHGQMLNPAIGWLLDILITIAYDGCEGEAPECARELPLQELIELIQADNCDDTPGIEGEWMPVQEYLERLRKEEEET